MNWPAAVELSGPHARLLPLAASHHDGLCDAVRDGELWKLWYTSVPSPEGMAAEIERRLALPTMRPVTVLDASGRIGGMTTYMHIDAVHRRARRSTRSASACCSGMPSRRSTASRSSSARTG